MQEGWVKRVGQEFKRDGFEEQRWWARSATEAGLDCKIDRSGMRPR